MSESQTPAVELLIVDDDEDLREMLVSRFRRQGLTVHEAGDAPGAVASAERHRFDVALLDLHLPGVDGIELLEQLKRVQPEIEAVMLTAHGSIETAIQAMKQGAYDYLTKPFHLPELELHLQRAAEKAKLARRARQWVDQIEYESHRYRLVGSSEPMQKVRRLIQRVAPSDATVLIRGASGTGKELVARALHYNSPRRHSPLVTVNCAALQETLLESELFGHEKGSFTGATQAKSGLVEVAEGGTLFIDEVAEMAPGLQAKLLRVLEDGHYRRVGSVQEKTAHVRILAATNKPLEDEMNEGRFRDDLFYRLNVVTVDLPSLGDRRTDIQELIDHLLASRQTGPTPFEVLPDALVALTHYDWPGNVRELVNVLERASILAEGNRITLDDLPENITEKSCPSTDPANPFSLRKVERRHVLQILDQEKGNKVRAAKALGVSRRALYRLIDKHQLTKHLPSHESQ